MGKQRNKTKERPSWPTSTLNTLRTAFPGVSQSILRQTLDFHDGDLSRAVNELAAKTKVNVSKSNSSSSRSSLPQRAVQPFLDGVRMGHFAALSIDLLLQIFSVLKLVEQGVLMQVCSDFRQVIQANVFNKRDVFSLNQTYRSWTDIRIVSLVRCFGTLSDLHFRNCENFDSWPSLFALPVMQTLLKLDLSGCGRVDDQAIQHLCSAASVHGSGACLRSLDLARTSVTDQSLRLLSTHFPSLQDLCMESCLVTDNGTNLFFSSISDRKEMSLDLSKCKEVSGVTLKMALKSPSIAHLRARFCRRICSVDASVCSSIRSLFLCKCDNLSSVSISNAPLLEEINVSDCSMLQLLALSDCPCLTDLAAGTCVNLSTLRVASCPKLSELNLSSCRSLDHDYLEKVISTCETTLRCLRLSGCRGLASLRLQKAMQLTELDLKGCALLSTLHLYSPLLASLWLNQCSSLVDLVLHTNKLGTVQLKLQNIKSVAIVGEAFTELKMEDCPLLTSVRIGQCPAMQTLYLSNCPALSPETVGDIRRFHPSVKIVK